MDFNSTSDIIGGNESQVIVGNGAYAVTKKMYGFALTVRSQGTIISAISIDAGNGTSIAYAPTWLGISLNQGDYFVSLGKILSITLTAATDSITLHCKM